MKRMFYLTGNLDSTEQISIDLHNEGITDWHFHVISKDEAGLYKRHVHSASLIEKSDLIRFGERGGLIGFAVACIATGYLMSAEPLGAQVSGLVYIAIFGFITLFGAWVGGLTGIATENHKIASYHADLEAGKYLILVDVRKSQEGRVREVMARRHPEAELVRVDSTFVSPFSFSRPATA